MPVNSKCKETLWWKKNPNVPGCLPESACHKLGNYSTDFHMALTQWIEKIYGKTLGSS